MTTTVGERTRASILDEAARLATVEGLEGLSIGQLASAIGMSKSGLYAHFQSKEELQLATIDTARAIFAREVIEPGMAAPEGERLRGVCEAFLSHVQREVFPGGCFFASAAAEVGTRRTRVRDVIAQEYSDWTVLLADLVREAQKAGRVSRKEDPEQVAFELNAILVAANGGYILQRDGAIFTRAREALGRYVRA
jgi:AcrR family transcriptional regulator